MKAGKRLLLFISLLVGFVLVVLLLAGVPIFGTSDPLFHGKPESQWIRELHTVGSDPSQQWDQFGPEGVPVLLRGFERASRPGGTTYLRLFSKLPPSISRWLPAPMDPAYEAGTREMALEALDGCDISNVALPVAARALDDVNPTVRFAAMDYFVSPGRRLTKLSPTHKLPMLPSFLRLARDPDKDMRGIAIGALGDYPDCPQARSAIAGVLRNSLADPYRHNRLYAAWSLNRIAPELLRESGAATILITNLRSGDAYFSHAAAVYLGKARSIPDLAVPALIECLESTNASGACTSASALTNFLGQTNVTIPALEAATTRPDEVARRARESLDFIRSHQPDK